MGRWEYVGNGRFVYTGGPKAGEHRAGVRMRLLRLSKTAQLFL